VAEHIFFTSILAYVIALDINYEYDKAIVHVSDVVTKAIVHDMDEALTGDFIRPFKYSSPELRRALHEACQHGMTRALSGTEVGKILLDRWASSKDDTVEGGIVHLADLWSVVIYARREFLLGNSYARKILTEVAHWINNATWHELVEPYARGIAHTATATAYEHSAERTRMHASEEMMDPFYRDFLSTKGGKDDDVPPEPTQD
jgi:5'-deoxynucleotidase YfbR-like HD superfamily hydrolase